MKRFYYSWKVNAAAIAILSLAGISCKSEGAEETVTKPKYAPVDVKVYANAKKSAPILAPKTKQDTNVPSMAQSNSTVIYTERAVSPVAKGTNPPHGKPGHRCDLPIGAPLSNASPIAQKTTTVIPTIESKVVPVAKTEKGMNPAHGQPNHRCDIAVGAPLDSKPPVVAPTPTNSVPALLVPNTPAEVKTL